MSVRKVLVTGGSGFVGSNLVRRLLALGYRVAVVDNFFNGRKEFLPDGHPGLSVYRADIRNQEKMEKITASVGPDTVFHLAALHYIPYCNAHPVETVDVNVLGTQSVLEACRQVEDLRTFVYASTAAVYGISDEPVAESSEVKPVDIYGSTKYFGEHLVRIFAEQTGVACRVARLFNIYGPNETNPHVIPAILEQLNGKTEVALGNLEPKRDYIYVEDVVEALLALAARVNSPFDVFNVGTGREYSVEELVRLVGDVIGTPISIRQDPERIRKTDRLHLVADITKIYAATGWRPRFDIQTGLRRLIELEYPQLLALERQAG